MLTFFTTTVTVFLATTRALNKQQITSKILTIGMGIAGFATLMTLRNNLGRNMLSKALVKHKVLAMELIL
jgi:hypothetical protein